MRLSNRCFKQKCVFLRGKLLEKFVIDTNVLLVSISTKSKLHWIFQALLNGVFTLCVTTDIIEEYAEIVGKHMGKPAMESLVRTLEGLPNVELITRYYKFHLLQDPDDNKFVDCAIISNAQCIVSHDTDFASLQAIDFPKVRVMNTTQFKEFLQTKSLLK